MREKAALAAPSAFGAALALYAAALPVSMAAVNFALALVLLFALVCSSLRNKAWSFPPSIFILLLFFFWAACTEMIAAGRFEPRYFAAFSKTWNFLPYVALPLAAAPSGSVQRALKILAAAGAAVVVLGAVEYWTGVHYFFEGWFGSRPLVFERRFYGFQSYPMHTGGLYAVLFASALGLGLFYRPSGRSRAFWWCASALLALGVLLTISRAYFIALFVIAGLLLAARGWKGFATGAAAGALLLAAMLAFNPYFRQRMQTINWRHSDKSGEQRLVMWKCAAALIRERPLFGVGYHGWRANFPAMAAREFPGYELEEALLGHAHNSYLTVGAETGLPGLALLLLFWLALLREQGAVLRASERGSLAYALALAGIAAGAGLMVAGLFEHNLLTATVALGFAFLIGLSRIAERKASA